MLYGAPFSVGKWANYWADPGLGHSVDDSFRWEVYK